MKNFIYEFRTRRIRRSHAMEARPLMQPDDAAAIARAVTSGEAREVFLVFFLDTRNWLVGYETVGIGTLNGIEVHPREVFRTAILAPASAIVLAHNHPSGDCTPSDEDRALTARLREAGDLMGIPVLDHVIVSEDDHFSMARDEAGRFSRVRSEV